MKVVVSMDGDGHFDVAKLSDRAGTIRVLQSAQDGEYYDMVVDDFDKEDYSVITNYNDYSKTNFERVIREFVQRGTVEIVNI